MSEVLLIIIVAAISMVVTVIAMYHYYANEMKKYMLLEISKLPEIQIRDWRAGKCKVSIRFTYPTFKQRHLSVVREESTNDKED